MSTDAPRGLAGYVEALVAALAESDPVAHARLRRAVGGRRARIELGGEAIVVEYRGEALEVRRAAGGERVHGSGATDAETVRDLLHGRIEVHEAILGGRLHVAGASEDVERMFLAIEILLDVAPRSPRMRRLADELLAAVPPGPGTAVGSSEPAPPSRGELDMLARLDLLP